ncbi:UNVERIFIED_ORG: hypothetical protein L601_005100000190, partial [Gordonia westfalica J30]
GDFYLATSGDLDLATSGDFLMAMDRRSAKPARMNPLVSPTVMPILGAGFSATRWWIDQDDLDR